MLHLLGFDEGDRLFPHGQIMAVALQADAVIVLPEQCSIQNIAGQEFYFEILLFPNVVLHLADAGSRNVGEGSGFNHGAWGDKGPSAGNVALMSLIRECPDREGFHIIAGDLSGDGEPQHLASLGAGETARV